MVDQQALGTKCDCPEWRAGRDLKGQERCLAAARVRRQDLDGTSGAGDRLLHERPRVVRGVDQVMERLSHPGILPTVPAGGAK
jgi:hypothetical protein